MSATVTAAAGAALGLVAAAAGVAGVLGVEWSLRVPWLVPPGGLELTLDPLGGFFLALVGTTAVPASIHAGGQRGERGGAAFLAFVAAMAAVPLAGNAITFLLAWELMSVASYVLVLGARDSRESLSAAWVYFVMTHAGLACLLAAMLLLGSWTDSLRFADWSAAPSALSPGAGTLAFVLLALGFGAKAGVIPLHVWLPMAHPAAPSHVSALMSGAMVKLGIYGLLRAGLDWLGPGPAWWGVAVMLAGTASALVGVLYALVDRDLKRVLAFSTIENVGIVLVAVGACMVFRASGLEALAVLSLAAGLYHALNHAAFKALLFLGAGAVVRAAGTRNLESMGGLVRRMPWTAAAFLTGSVAIAALPPLNGFVSEWLTFQALLQMLEIPRPELNLVFALGIAGLALTGGLAVACFVRAFGIVFLALPRSDQAAAAREAGIAPRAAMGLLAAACVALGLAPTLVLPALAGVASAVLGTPALDAPADWLTVTVSGRFGGLSTVAVAAALGGALLLPLAALALARAPGRRPGETWGCGRILQTARMEYTGTAFAHPFQRIFDFFYRPVKRLDIDVHAESRFFVRRLAYENRPRPIFEEWLYRPALEALHRAAHRARALQSGSANVYLLYIVAALLVMLVLA